MSLYDKKLSPKTKYLRNIESILVCDGMLKMNDLKGFRKNQCRQLLDSLNRFEDEISDGIRSNNYLSKITISLEDNGSIYINTNNQ